MGRTESNNSQENLGPITQVIPESLVPFYIAIAHNINGLNRNTFSVTDTGERRDGLDRPSLGPIVTANTIYGPRTYAPNLHCTQQAVVTITSTNHMMFTDISRKVLAGVIPLIETRASAELINNAFRTELKTAVKNVRKSLKSS